MEGSEWIHWSFDVHISREKCIDLGKILVPLKLQALIRKPTNSFHQWTSFLICKGDNWNEGLGVVFLNIFK